ncbi:MAG: hypothetical protein KC445_03675 [Anaerolineales bacterium]|nr:hypothetical protein [Anaerolineales bacterium]
MSFEWRTDEDEGWPEEVTAEETAVTPQSFLRRRWRFLLVSLLGLLAVWLVVQWQIDQRVAETTATIENEILATHNFVLQTAVSQDESLFHANLSGRNPDWTELQKTLLNQGLLLNRPMLGWEHQASANRLTPADVTFELDPDLQGAALSYPQVYASQTGAQVTETVVLQQTAVYRKGTSRWLYAPPDDDFWGNWITQQGDYLTLAFTERDNEVATVLAIQLDRLLGQMCTEMADMNCGPDFQVHLRFDTDPQSLLALNEIETMLKAGLQLELPTPTLIGLPTDEASAEALYRAYGVQLFTAVLAHQIDYDCCRHQLFFRALRDYQLAQLGLQPWPLTPAMYRQMLDNGFDGDVTRHWTRRWEEAPPQFLQVWVIEDPDPIWQQVYMLVEFLAAEETAVSPTQMMRLMDRNSYDAWLAGLVPSHKRPTLEDRFLLYINNQIIPGQQAEPPIPLPNGHITLVCQNYTDRPTSHVYSYDLAQKTWTERFRDMFTNAYFSTRDGEHFIVSEYDFVDGTSEWEISLATDEEIILLEKARSPGENEYWLDYSLIDEDAQYFIRYEYFGGETDIRLLPLACVDGSCPAVQLDGYPLFSPDKALFLIESAPGEMINVDSSVPFQLLQNLYLMTPDGAVRQSLGQGSDPFWLTNTVYGYVRLGDDGWELVTAVVNQNQPRYLLSQADLLAAMPADARPDGLFVTSVAANPANAQEILLQIRNDAVANQSGPDVPSYLFKVTLTDDLAGVNEVKLLRQDFFSGIFGFWRDGRTIIYGEYGFEYLDVNWQMLNPETGQTERSFQSLVSLAGTQDGQWLVQVTDSYLLLRALAYDYQYFIPHSFQDCQWAVLSAAE